MKRLAAIGLCVAFVAAVYMVAFVISSRNPTKWEASFRPKTKTKFDPDRWRELESGEVRYTMANDLTSRDLLQGKRQNEIENILGPPDSQEVSAKGRTYNVYDLISQREMPAQSLVFPDSWFLNFEKWSLYVVVESGLVTEASIRAN